MLARPCVRTYRLLQAEGGWVVREWPTDRCSAVYPDQRDARYLRDWLEERRNGYPKRLQPKINRLTGVSW